MVIQDPAAVAAQEAGRRKAEKNLTIVLGVGIGVAALVFCWNYVRDVREAMQIAKRPKQPWEV